MQTELQSVKERLSRCESSTITGKKLLLLQSQIEQLQEENYRLDPLTELHTEAQTHTEARSSTPRPMDADRD